MIEPCSDAYWRQREHWYPDKRWTRQHTLCLIALPFVLVLLIGVNALAIVVILIADGIRKVLKS